MTAVGRGTILLTGAGRGPGAEMIRQSKRRLLGEPQTGVPAMVEAIEKRRPRACVPPWPWVPVAAALRVLPLSVVRMRT